MSRYRMFVVEDWYTGEEIAAFYTDEAREDWLETNAEWFPDGWYQSYPFRRICCCIY